MFASPLWLYALATLAIPLALHLWSRRPRQLIRVGSLRHIADLAEARSWSARLTEPLLLLLRLGLLTAVVLALAGPRIGTGRLGSTASRLVLVEPELLEDTALVRRDPLLDSLARSRVTVRLLVPGLPRVQLDGVGSDLGVPEEERRSGRAALWDLLVAADRLVTPGGSMLVIARPRVVRLGGRRPTLAARVVWYDPAPQAERSEWLAGRWSVTPDSAFEVAGWGTPRGTGYRSRMLDGPAQRGAADAPVTVVVQGRDSASRQRLRLAAFAVGTMLGQQVRVAAEPGRADLVLTTAAPSDSLLAAPHRIARVSPAVLRSSALADSVLAQWPWNRLVRDPDDPREVSLAQAMPGLGGTARPDQRDARPALLLLALMFFAVERWLATRPRRGPA
ncbi:MAG TPA: BatA domain-containing protein [Gemmatimonadales bacterium]|nr:BatA domain-containing protein [Gemmatimonadales bacterium]